MIKFWLIRHGMTEGNKHNRYIGKTDEPLCAEGRAFIEGLDCYPNPQAVYVSPLKRAVETAQILFPDMGLRIVEELAECDFGEFENKNYQELDGNPRYQAWVDSGAALPFPGGESREGFKARSTRAFEKVVQGCHRSGVTEAAVVTHGGIIMNLMEDYADVRRPFYEWHMKNGGGYCVTLDEGLWRSGRRTLVLCEEIMRG